MDESKVKALLVVALNQMVTHDFIFLSLLLHWYYTRKGRQSREGSSRPVIRYSLNAKVPEQIKRLYNLVYKDEDVCINHLRMGRAVFSRLCVLCQIEGGLQPTSRVSVPYMVAMFIQVLGHHVKNQIIKHDFLRSAETVSRHFNAVLRAIIKLHPTLLAKATPVDEDYINDRWKCFQGCLGALHGTYIAVRIGDSEKPKYRNRKGDVSVNVLGVCDPNICFIYELTGWEGSAADGRVLRDAIARHQNFKVPIGNFYLCDGGYTNGKGFLAPYRGVRYHLDEWGVGRAAPQNAQEYFKMKHAKARNVIERAFGILKMRWEILRSPSWYPIKTQNKIILACCLLQNFIRTEMPYDPIELEYGQNIPTDGPTFHNEDFVDSVEPSPAWTRFRNELSQSMYANWSSRRCNRGQ